MKKMMLLLSKGLLGASLLVCWACAAQAQQQEVSGTVSDSAGHPLVGVTVAQKGTTAGTTTGTDGGYRLMVQDPATAILLFSYVGYEAASKPVEGRSVLNMKLQSTARGLNEVVVIGYGEQKKVNLTGAVATMDQQKLAGRPITSLSAAMEGGMPGVTVIQQSGQPGRDNAIVRIRGVGTMNNADPMVVIDGMVSTTDAMDNLNPSDIASISVLKDAAASAIYGSRAANGVVLITTKRGQQGTPKVSYSGYAGWQVPTNLPDYLNSYQYARLLNEGLQNEGKPVRYSDEELEKFRTGSDPYKYPNTDWAGLLFQGSGFQQSHDLSLTAGTQTTQYFLSLGYLDQDGTITHTRSNRYNVRFNIDTRVSDLLSVGLTSSVSSQYIGQPTGAAPDRTDLSQILRQAEDRIPPTALNKNEDGSWARYIDGNPIYWVEEGGLLEDQISRAMGNAYLELSPLQGLKIRGSAGIDYKYLDRSTHIKQFDYGDGTSQGPNSIAKMNERTMRNLLQLLVTYQHRFGDHDLQLLGGTSREGNQFTHNEASRQNLPNNELTDINAGASAGMANAGYSYQERLGSFFGRANYNYKQRYLAEVDLRYDGSSKFAADQRWGVFPSASVGWRLSEEDFMKSVRFVNNLKLRASYGSVGNNATGNYQYLPKITLGQDYPFGGTISSGAAQTTSANAVLQWEKSTTFDIGLDAMLFQDKLSFTADYYNRYTDNILTAVPVSTIYGLPAPTINAGAMRNTGVELQLGYREEAGALHYNVSVNAGFNHNNVVRYATPAKAWRIQAVGYPWNAFFGYQNIGKYQTDDQVKNAPKVPGAPVKKGDLMFRDQNGDGIIDGDDRVLLGSDIPGVTFGFNLSLAYRQFDAAVFLQGAADVDQVLNNEVFWPLVNGANAQKMALDRWTPETPHGRFPLTHVDESYNYDVLSSFQVNNSSYLRAKNVQVGYTVPQAVAGALKIEKIRLYFSAQNLFTLTGLQSGVDPESQVDSQYRYPNVKTYTFGLNVHF